MKEEFKMLRFLSAGESHGQALVAILEGMPAGLKVEEKEINAELKRRQLGLGRGPRMRIEQDKVEIISGFKNGISLGSPIAVLIKNKDASMDKLPAVYFPRPGHADLNGALKYGFRDIRNVLERASARETASRVAIGSICKIFLRQFKIIIQSRLVSIGAQTRKEKIMQLINQAKQAGDSLGGIFEVVSQGLPPGLGSYAQWDRRLDSRLGAAIFSIPGVKAVEFGIGFAYAQKFGSQVHDAIYFKPDKGYFRKTNHAGGLEGGLTNGQPLIIRACMKPIATLARPLPSVDMRNKKPAKASVQRADICAVEAAGVIAEHMCALVIADAFLEKFGADALEEISANYQHYLKKLC